MIIIYSNETKGERCEVFIEKAKHHTCARTVDYNFNLGTVPKMIYFIYNKKELVN